MGRKEVMRDTQLGAQRSNLIEKEGDCYVPRIESLIRAMTVSPCNCMDTETLGFPLRLRQDYNTVTRLAETDNSYPGGM
jgi:hypothetical protein